MKLIKKIYKRPDCEKCLNTRVVEFTDNLYGIRTKDCQCVKYDDRVERLKKSRIPENYIEFEYDDYDHDIVKDEKDATNAELKSNKKDREQNRNMHIVLGKMMKEHQKVYDNGVDILLYGPKACGKTMLGVVYLKSMILEYGYSGLFTTGEELILLAMEKSNFKSDDSFNGLTFESLLNVDFLMIDGFDKLMNSKIYPMMKVTINTIIKQRKNDNKMFILTSEKDLDTSRNFVSEMVYTLKSLPFKGSCIDKVRESLDKTLGL